MAFSRIAYLPVIGANKSNSKILESNNVNKITKTNDIGSSTNQQKVESNILTTEGAGIISFIRCLEVCSK